MARDFQISPQLDLVHFLREAALTHNGIIIYPPAQNLASSIQLSYGQLLLEAKTKAGLLRQIEAITGDSVILLHFDNHKDNIEWFWATAAAGFLPALSTPLPLDTKQREKHLSHLHTLLKDPIILTNERLVKEFTGLNRLAVIPVERLSSQKRNAHHIECHTRRR